MENIDVLRLYGLAHNFWQLTLNVANEVIIRENPSSMSYQGWGTPTDDEYDEYDEHVKWSDINIIEPTLFNFYHGIELSLKALISAKGINIKKDHKLSSLLKKVKTLYNDNKAVIEFYEKYILLDKNPYIIQEFCQKSNMTMDLYFQSLKYPTSTQGVEFNHSYLRYNDEAGIELFIEISTDLKKARKNTELLLCSELQTLKN